MVKFGDCSGSRRRSKAPERFSAVQEPARKKLKRGNKETRVRGRPSYNDDSEQESDGSDYDEYYEGKRQRSSRGRRDGDDMSFARQADVFSLRRVERKSYNYDKMDKDLDKLLSEKAPAASSKSKVKTVAPVIVDENADSIEAVLMHRNLKKKDNVDENSHMAEADGEKERKDGKEEEGEDVDDDEEEDSVLSPITEETEFFVKWKNWAHRHNEWGTRKHFEDFLGVNKIDVYIKEAKRDLKWLSEHAEPDEVEQYKIVRELHRQELQDQGKVEKVIGIREGVTSDENESGQSEYLIKWNNVQYDG